jgi:hypothetical protein
MKTYFNENHALVIEAENQLERVALMLWGNKNMRQQEEALKSASTVSHRVHDFLIDEGDFDAEEKS